jgi:hypothetical protein
MTARELAFYISGVLIGMLWGIWLTLAIRRLR